MPSALSRDQVEKFQATGYLPYHKLLTDDEISQLRVECDRAFEDGWRSGDLRILSTNSCDIKAQLDAPEQVWQIIQLSERSCHFLKLLYDTRFLDVVQDLIGPNIMLFHDQALYKPPNSGGEVFGHQDNGYWLAKPANLVSCWLTLDDVSVESGAMQFLPGSHFAELNHQRPDILLQAEVSNVSDTVILEIGAAECLFHHCLAPHRTAPNTSERDRRAIAIHYMQPGTRRENGDGIAVSFESPLVRMAV